ncbi:MAG TPA: peptidoglycan DD-metalloendopeptidase family protein [Actinomycetota bacterium]|nr:peptidoglycan DD-metalloendopeptidase family protein [Actinomycetota bacterium]
MATRLRRVSTLVLLVASLLIPDHGSAAGDSQLEKIRAERAALLEKIDAHEAEAATLDDKVDALNARMIDLRRDLVRLDAQLAGLESQVRSAQARIDETQARMDKIKAVATEQAVMLYKAGATDTLDTLLDSETLAELDARAEFLGVAAALNTDELVEYGRLQATIESQHRELFARKRELNEVKITQNTLLAQLDKDHAELAEELNKLEGTLAEEHRHEGDLAFAQARLEGDIDAALARQASAARGTSVQGFIWPLNGAITSYYGPRWGRMHEGIDIDGVTGQPVIASNSGVVILSSYYSGYGNAVVIDHGGGITTLYGHHSELNVSVGQEVSRGDMVGKVGCTGSCTGDHLHFEVRVNGSPVDPLTYLP